MAKAASKQKWVPDNTLGLGISDICMALSMDISMGISMDISMGICMETCMDTMDVSIDISIHVSLDIHGDVHGYASISSYKELMLPPWESQASEAIRRLMMVDLGKYTITLTSVFPHTQIHSDRKMTRRIIHVDTSKKSSHGLWRSFHERGLQDLVNKMA